VVTGNPIRGGFKKADREAARRELGVSDKPLVLSCGGSLGARALNDAVADMLAFSVKDGQMQHLHATGAVGHERMMERLAQRHLTVDGRDGITVKEYIYNMSECMAAADVVISRAGAISLAEIAAMGKPSILIPSPNVAENHQYHNACVLRDAGAALLIEEKDLNGESLYQALTEVALDSEKRSRMAKAALELAETMVAIGRRENRRMTAVVSNMDTPLGNCIGNNGLTQSVPVIGDGLDLGIGACVLGDVKLGNDIKVGANAVVVRSAQGDGLTLVGIPAHVK
jgi:UDP-N-acetylglucosamine--N-acetylmuramyl-(pentapeptide) pyrophosphoryl-undecaprenol N-acetylglucosamine transferase